ncbi:ShlB/FhaC/HecB family hemolysin secretion/activation protein [Nafulsella turpanensis]|uniref:ShlB/FhaC/HecB family hemolysin secretion/activation protein n=1 Tax=Nafulsella turpanensis TaxID=1265690 RepID=UPI000347529F|nr:ShlB/FhaC/HecB family hemolysin secretion/activation protein [Nafulsella turpanensis]
MCAAIFFVQACGAIKPYYSEEVEDWPANEVPPAEELVSSVFLIGDVGAPEIDGQEPSLKLLQLQLHGIGGTDALGTEAELPDSMKSVIFLGDNIYYDGLSEIDDPERPDEERRLMEQMKIVKNWDGKAVFIPGNHDWNFSSEGGLAAVIRQEAFVEAYLEDEEAFLPNLGCPGPYPLHVSEDLVLILLDSEWWLTENRRPEGSENGCGVASELDMIVQLEDMLDRYKNKHVVLALHHPLMTNGNHGGHFSIMDHIFPLTLIYSDLYVPLPVIGSIYPLARMYGVSRQDLTNPKYAQLRDALFSILEGRNNVVVAAGHEHSLQLLEYEGIQQIVSGSGCKEAFCVGGGQALFAHQHEGFARLNYYENGETWVEFWEPVEDGSEGRLVFRKPLYALATPENQPVKEEEIPDYTDSVKVIAANPDFNELGFLGRRIWGDHYREEWEQPLEVPYLDLERTKGGLSVVKKGGGQQTLSLHLMDEDSLTYYFRSVDKFPAGVLPEGFETTFAAEIVKDQISSSHPYGALALAKMAEAADVYYAEPELYYMPYTPSLGPYLNEFGGMLGLLELKADEDVSDYENFGNAENAVSTRTLFEHLYEDNDNEVNQESYLRTRLFDMLIGDWDRHEGQWRWAEFEKEGKGSVFEPIPKDRDQVFVKYDGLLPWLFSRKWALRKFQNFDYNFEDVVGLNINGTYLDRRLMTDLDWEEWEEEIKFLQEELTDSVIEASIKDLPPEIFEISGEEIIAKLKSRRDQLLKAGKEYYEVLSEYVDVVGTNKHERFEVKRLPNGFTKVVVHKTEKDGKVEDKLYERTFDPALTEEIRLYGLDGIDKFFISGTAEDAIELRIIGGDEDDIYRDSSSIEGWDNTIIYYDEKDGENEITAGEETRLKLTNKAYLNEYDPEEFSYPYVGPRLSVEYNRDDGLFLGGGINVKTYGFRKKPVATDQTLLANYAIGTGAFTFRYRGIFYSLFSEKLDLLLDADVYGPKYMLNYFGQGNSSLYEEDISFYRINQNRVEISPFVSWEVHELFRLGIGPSFQYVDVGTEENREKFIDSDVFRQSPLFAEYTSMAGGRLFAELEALNDDVSPTRGIHWTNELTYYNSLNHDKVNLTRLSTDLVLYVSPDINFSPTLALRFGGQRNYGDYLFYQSATLGGKENLRGYRRTRFAGDAALYQNTELRVPVGGITNYVFTGTWGVYGFLDHGRIWSDVPESGEWHRSYGPGLFLNLFDLFVASGSVGFSEEGHYFTLNAGYFFE